MKKPLKPSGFSDLLSNHREELPKIIALSREKTPQQYHHWDILKHLETPNGLNHEQWWLAIKLGRNAHYRSIPLRDKIGKHFCFVMTDEIQEGCHQIDSKAHGNIATLTSETGFEHKERYIVNSLMEEAITSSLLEGAVATRKDAKEMIRTGRKPRDISERMILNNFRAMQEIQVIKDKPMTEERLMTLHRTLTENTLKNPTAVGRIQRSGEERVQVWDERDQTTLHNPPPADQLPERLRQLLSFANIETEERFIHPMVRAIILHFWMAYDHPFEDGNGRVARALFYWAMLHHGYWLFEFLSISRLLREAPAKYARSFLYTETDDNDITYFILYQLDIIKRAITDLEHYLQKKIDQVKSVEARLHRSGLNHRQLALLSHAIRHPGHTYTIKSHGNSHNIAYATARSDLLKLANISLLEKIARGKTYVFIAPADVEDRIG